MTDFPIRRAQLIAPFGVGAIVTSVDGVSAIVAGLDHWVDSNDESFDAREFFIADEWRLNKALGVDGFVLPPDFRIPFGYSSKGSSNSFVTLPALRFPLWNFCPSCHKMMKVSRYELGLWACGFCQAKSPAKKQYLIPKVVQIQFLAMCHNGHIQDFPFQEWVHRQTKPTCAGELTVSFTGATLATQSVRCSCGQYRSFDGIFGTVDAAGLKTNLSNRLSSEESFLCKGLRPWLDDFQGEGCGEQLIGGIKGAINNYYSYVRSAIFLPKKVSGIPQELIETLQMNEFQNFLEATEGISGSQVLQMMERSPGLSVLIKPFVEKYDVSRAIDAVRNDEVFSVVTDPRSSLGDELKIAEYEVFTSGESMSSQVLKMEEVDRHRYGGERIASRFSKIVIIDRLKETRALIGFGRIRPETDKPLGELRKMLRRSEGPKDRWLPAYEVFGEGIFFDLNTPEFRRWSANKNAIERVSILKGSDTFLKLYPNVTDNTFLPRFVALHTLAHLLISAMVFECGYSAASLRERIYCGAIDEGPILPNGILIYTASGDSQGSMGGLVRIGKPGRLELLIEAAIDKARFCSSDPVCMEFGKQGQGPDSLNLAACHNCALLPETSCEQFNTFLDRGLIVGSFEDAGLGYMNG